MTYQTYELTNGLTNKVIWKVASRLVIKTIILTSALDRTYRTDKRTDGQCYLVATQNLEFSVHARPLVTIQGKLYFF